MNRFKTYTTTIIALLFVGLLTGCDLLEQDDRTLEGSYLGFADFTDTASEPAGGAAAVEVTETIQLIGPHRSADIQVNYIVSGESTAQEGVHYTLNSTSPVTISANSSETEVSIDLLDSPMASGESAILILEIQGAGDSDLPVAENFKIYTLTIAGND
jgi:hypothetical protein